jgi:methionyl aminopeptidase
MNEPINESETSNYDRFIDKIEALALDESAAVAEVKSDVIDVEDDEDDDEETGNPGDDEANKKKKKKKKRNKKKKAANPESTSNAPKIPSQLPFSRNVKGFTDYYVAYGQTEPPTIPVADLFPSGEFPVGQELPHHTTKYPDPYSAWTRMTEEEKRANERIMRYDFYEKARHAAEVQRQVRAYAQSFIKPGIKLADMCEMIENCNRQLVKENGLQAGIGFPTGCSLNHVAAHYTPNPGDNTVLQYSDVMKIDFGTQIEG